jgi:hypothetical protein
MIYFNHMLMCAHSSACTSLFSLFFIFIFFLIYLCSTVMCEIKLLLFAGLNCKLCSEVTIHSWNQNQNRWGKG